MKLRFLQPLVSLFAPRLAAAYSNIMGCTTAYKIVGTRELKSKRDIFDYFKEGVIYCCWHSRFFYFSYFGKGQDVYTMISRSKDGEVITRTIARQRLWAIRGSSSNGGAEALIETAEVLRHNHRVLMIPDGPRGPRYQIKPGVIRLAQITGRPILPLGFSSTRGIFFPSWDRFFLPLPFGKAALVITEPIYIQPNLSHEEFDVQRLRLEKIMNELRDEADRICGRDPEAEIKKWRKKEKEKKKEKL